MPAIPPTLLKGIPTLTHVVSESSAPTLGPQESLQTLTNDLQSRLSERLVHLVDELVQDQLNALRPILRERIQAAVQDIASEDGALKVQATTTLPPKSIR
jgi:hypothetical protein